jgi:hypothetical protein
MKILCVLATVLALRMPANAGEGRITASPPAAVKLLSVRRSTTNPLITPALSKTLGTNINGPSVIRVPVWIKSPLGKYYMYFAHHSGKHIRLAYADALHGPWRIYEPGTLQLKTASAFQGHIASPDVHVDEKDKQIRMYFHGPAHRHNDQKTGVATSQDGVHFEASDRIVGDFYFRVFEKDGVFYAIDRWGVLLRSKDPMGEFEGREKKLIKQVRHTAVLKRGKVLLVFYSRTGDSPERILLSTVRLSDDWSNWMLSEPIEVLAPQKDYEGIQYPVKPSSFGSATKVCELRDPCIFEEEGKIFLFYTIGGEMGIAMAAIEISANENAEPNAPADADKPYR